MFQFLSMKIDKIILFNCKVFPKGKFVFIIKIDCKKEKDEITDRKNLISQLQLI